MDSLISLSVFPVHHSNDIVMTQDELLAQNATIATDSFTPASNCLTLQHIKSPSLNLPFGNLITTPKHKNNIRLFFNNINGIYTYSTWTQLQKTIKDINNLSIDIVGFAETNIKWDHRNEGIVWKAFQQQYKSCNIATSSNSEKCLSQYQPGGTLTAITNNLTGHIRSKINDDILGRWSGFQTVYVFWASHQHPDCLSSNKIRRLSNQLSTTTSSLPKQRAR
jgi:hypothetical protein